MDQKDAEPKPRPAVSETVADSETADSDFSWQGAAEVSEVPYPRAKGAHEEPEDSGDNYIDSDPYVDEVPNKVKWPDAPWGGTGYVYIDNLSAQCTREMEEAAAAEAEAAVARAAAAAAAER